MKKSPLFFFMIILSLWINCTNLTQNLTVHIPLTSFNPPSTDVETQLTIYSYESLLADPGYDFITAFSTYKGITSANIQLILVEDANTLLSKLILEKNQPSADVVIGLDNILIHPAKAQDVLVPYESPALENISRDLVLNLDPEFYLLPYDYGIIALWADSTRLNNSILEQFDNLTLDEFLSFDLDKQLVIEDPTLSSTGLGFLLWTIAVYGDPSAGINGLLDSNWQNWWKTARKDIRIASSWGEAFNIWYAAEENRPIMISYGTSPAYSACLYNDTSQIAVVSHELNQKNAWLQIEGIGLVKNAPHSELAREFIDWFLGPELQAQIPMNNWMYPANNGTNLTTCFQNAAIPPDSVELLNSLLSPTVINQNLDRWKSEWEALISEQGGFVIQSYPWIFMTIGWIGGLIYIIMYRAHRFNFRRDKFDSEKN